MIWYDIVLYNEVIIILVFFWLFLYFVNCGLYYHCLSKETW